MRHVIIILTLFLFLSGCGGPSPSRSMEAANHFASQAVGYQLEYSMNDLNYSYDDYSGLYVISGPVSRKGDGKLYDIWVQLKDDEGTWKLTKLRIDREQYYP